MGIQVKHVSKSFGSFQALKDVSIEVPQGELVALLGPSGCGKTTLLRIIAGLEQPDAGSVYIEHADKTHENVQNRKIGFVFQHYALFRHMSVFENVAFGLKVRPRSVRPSKPEIHEKVMSLLKLVQLDFLADRYPSQLSGGQRQRIALARALAVEPKILLLDEPFGALDAQVRKDLRKWLRRLHQELHITSIFVTHDQEEAMELANYIVVMNKGEVIQIGSPEEVYHQPKTPFVYQFLGDVNIFHCRFHEGNPLFDDSFDELDTIARHNDYQVFIRPHAFDVSLHRINGNSIAGTILHINPAGPFVKIEIEGDHGNLVQANISQERYRDLQLNKGMKVYLIPKEIHTFCRG